MDRRELSVRVLAPARQPFVPDRGRSVSAHVPDAAARDHLAATRPGCSQSVSNSTPAITRYCDRTVARDVSAITSFSIPQRRLRILEFVQDVERRSARLTVL